MIASDSIEQATCGPSEKGLKDLSWLSAATQTQNSDEVG